MKLPMQSNHPSRRYESPVLVAVFLCFLVIHAILATRNWSVGFMAGHEFRQTQTALISHYIDQNDDFGLLYEQPILGKPWVGLLLEVPIYEWAVVGVKRTTGWSLIESARAVTLASFYLMLPAVYLLLGRFTLSPARRLLAILPVLCCPVYIFYSRAFLMDASALLCCVWFLWAYCRMMDRRLWYWFCLSSIFGVGAALIKSASFAVWLLPAAGYSLWHLYRDWTSKDGWWRFGQTIFWGIAGVIVPLGMLKLWIDLTDPIKAAHASAWIFTSKNLSAGNWGLTDIAARFSSDLWNTLAQRWGEAVLPPWILVVTLLAVLALASKRRWQIAGGASLFFLAQGLFPFAYAYQDYYFYACALFLAAAYGLGMAGIFEKSFPAWNRWALVMILPVAMLLTYARGYYPYQMVVSDGGFSFTKAIANFTPKESVIVVVGSDWASIVPYYAQRRALLIRNGLEYDQTYLSRAYNELADEEVSALILMWNQRQNEWLRDFTTHTFGLESAPTFSNERADIYVNKRYGRNIREELRNVGYYGDLRTGDEPQAPPRTDERFRISSGLARTNFEMIAPAPLLGRFDFGFGKMADNFGTVINAHPNADVWLRSPHDATNIHWEFGMFETSWKKDGPKTDGVVMSVTRLLPSGEARLIFERELDPVRNPADRGRQRVDLSYTPIAGEFLRFSSRPKGTFSYDWSYWASIEVR